MNPWPGEPTMLGVEGLAERVGVVAEHVGPQLCAPGRCATEKVLGWSHRQRQRRHLEGDRGGVDCARPPATVR